MTSVIAVNVDGRLLELTSKKLNHFNGLFEIDTVNLLLGKNGSGKTRFLLGIANALAVENSSTHLYLNKEDHQLSEHNICSIYFSALPYRRKLAKGAGLIDASPSFRSKITDEVTMLRQLGDVASALNLNTKLTGVLAYSRNFFRAILIPALSQSSVMDEEIEELLTRYKNNSTSPYSSDKNISELDARNERNLEKIENRVNKFIRNIFDGYDLCLWLSSIEHLHKHSEVDDKTKIVTAFLRYIGLASGDHGSEEFELLEDVVERTREILGGDAFLGEYDADDRAVKFTIRSIDDIESIRLYETPIKIEWTELSSGLHALTEQFSLIGKAIKTAASRRRTSILLLIDEGDAYLHLDWQRRYISLLNEYLGSLKKIYRLQSLQLILASHSPILAADLPGQLVTNLDADGKEEIKTFAAPIEDVIAGSFESSSMGEFAAKKINEIYSRAKKYKVTTLDRHIIKAIGDNAIVAALKREIGNDN